MSFIDWSIPQTYAQTEGITQENANRQLQQVQTARALNALRGTNIGDQSSVQRGINALTGLGMFDQAKALTDLEQTRSMNVASRPVALGSIDLGMNEINAEKQEMAGQSQTSSDQDQQQQFDAHVKGMFQDGADAVNDVLSYDDPALRDAAAAVQKQRLEAKYPKAKANIDEIFADTSPDALKKHEAFLTASANGDTTVPHPTGFEASKALLNSDPTYQDAQAVLSHWTRHPLARAALAKWGGLDISPGIATAENITNPARQGAANAAFAGSTAFGGTAGQRQAEGQYPSLGQGEQYVYNAQGGVAGIQMANGEIQNITARQQAQEAGTPREVYTQAGGTVVATPKFDGEGRATYEPGQIAGGGAAGQPGIAAKTGIGGEAAASTLAATESQKSAQGFPARMRDYENLRTAAAQIPTGPHANFWGFLGALKQEYAPDLNIRIGPNATNQANYEEVKKLAQRVLSYQADTLGLPKTNQSVDITSGATPHEETSPAGIQRLVGMLEGNEAYLNARNSAFNEWQRLNPGKGAETWNEFIPVWNASMDPGVFQAHFMTPAEAQTIRSRMTPARFDAMKAAAQRLGYFAGF